MRPVNERSSLVKFTRPIARFSVSPNEPTTSDTVQLFDWSSDPRDVGIAWRAWDFGDGATSVGLAPVHRYAAAGEYEVTLTLATFDGRVGIRSQRIAIGG
jgi:PKD repeat protein